MLLQMKYPLRKSSGFTLIEMLIVIAILGILASIAVPAYQDSVRKSRRGMLKVALMEAAQQFERCFTEFSNFRNASCPTEDNIEDRIEDYYSVVITLAPALPAAATTYTIVATYAAKGGQNKDSNCKTLSLNQAGTQTSTNSSDAVSTNCW